MNISTPSEQQLLLAGYILGDLDVEESLAVEKLLSSDPALQQELAELQSSLDQVYGQEIAPPPALKASVLAAAEQTIRSSAAQPTAQTATQPVAQTAVKPVSSPAAKAPATRRTTHFTTRQPSGSPRASLRLPKEVLLVATGVLAALSLYLGSQNYRLQQTLNNVRDQQLAAEQVDSAADLVTYSLDATENATENEQTSSVELSVNGDRLTAVLEVSGLPALPDDQVYALWTVAEPTAPATKDTKNAILTAVFTVDEAGDQIEKIVLPNVFRDRTQVQAIAITIEDAAAPQNHEASPILIHQL